MKDKFFSLIISLSIVLILPALVNAQLFSTWYFSLKDLLNFFLIEICGFPKEWLEFPEFIYYGIIPMAGIWMIVYGFMDRVQIFPRTAKIGPFNINLTLAFIIAFSTLPFRLFVLFVSTIFSIMGVWSVALFVVLFFGGTYAFGKTYWEHRYGIAEVELRVYREELERERKRRTELETELEKNKKEIEELEEKHRAGEIELKSAIKQIEELKSKADTFEREIEASKTREESLEERLKQLKEKRKKPKS